MTGVIWLDSAITKQGLLAVNKTNLLKAFPAIFGLRKHHEVVSSRAPERKSLFNTAEVSCFDHITAWGLFLNKACESATRPDICRRLNKLYHIFLLTKCFLNWFRLHNYLEYKIWDLRTLSSYLRQPFFKQKVILRITTHKQCFPD